MTVLKIAFISGKGTVIQTLDLRDSKLLFNPFTTFKIFSDCTFSHTVPLTSRLWITSTQPSSFLFFFSVDSCFFLFSVNSSVAAAVSHHFWLTTCLVSIFHNRTSAFGFNHPILSRGKNQTSDFCQYHQVLFICFAVVQQPPNSNRIGHSERIQKVYLSRIITEEPFNPKNQEKENQKTRIQDGGFSSKNEGSILLSHYILA
ncbi:hypothetical protein M9H77_12504 [Catharanthus roseus]|uniref:Uncharacterized protein n=1 Tax=Catharanthus roseus TaxID=4058 RepID=A0ACC0BHJ1_CATRO|nr:hypothetical protein M9H77_12504 [Catharanthus roseus]